MELPKWLDQEVARAYGLRNNWEDGTTPLFGGLQHEVWKVPVQDGYIVLKQQVRKPSDVALELEKAASAENISYAKLLPTSTGHQMLEVNAGSERGYLRAYDYIDGEILGREPISEELAYELGVLLADLHLASKKHLRNVLRKEFNNPVADYYVIDELGENTLKAVREFTTNFDITQRQAIIGHRDISGKNIIIENVTKKPLLIDFDEAGLTTVEGEVLDAAFNLAGVHTPSGAIKAVVQSFVAGYKSSWPGSLNFDRHSFHTLIGLSEYWWLGVCLNRIKDGRTSKDAFEEKEVSRLLKQLPRDMNNITEWLTWLK